MVRSVARDLPEQGKNNPAVNQAAGNGGQKMGQYSWFTVYEVIDGRDGRRSTIIISQFPIKSWFDLFREHTYADACLARITDKRHSYRLEMNGISMREAEK